LALSFAQHSLVYLKKARHLKKARRRDPELFHD
jgi:hypothetical protein